MCGNIKLTEEQNQLLKGIAIERMYTLDDNESLYQVNANLNIKESDLKLPIEKIKELIKEIEFGSIKPSLILVDYNSILICWEAIPHQMVVEYEVYLNLILEFLSYLKGFDDFDLVLNEGFFGDSPNKILSEDNYLKNYEPHFNSQYFGWAKKTTYFDFRN
jgi:hypothetical protein